MSDAPYIPKKIDRSELSFEELKQKGISTIQKLSGKVWTDFNIHDPGVTILEQLCYAITELGYRTSLPLEDLLASQIHTQGVNDTFYSAANILTCSPITVSDIRKLLIDRITGLRNIWVEPINLSNDAPQIRGLYMVMAEASPDLIDSAEELEKMKLQLKTELAKLSNLTESFDSIILLSPLKIFIQADIELTTDANVEKTNAEVLFKLSRCMTKPLKFYSLDEMLSAGQTSDNIFEGPRLLNGFVNESELIKKASFLNSSVFIKTITETAGVNTVKSLRLMVQKEDGSLTSPISKLSGNALKDVVFIGMSMIPVLGNDFNNSKTNNLLKYTRHNLPVVCNKDRTNKYLRAIQTKETVSYNNTFKVYNDLPIPRGTERSIVDYTSIQHHFPEIYGLGERGIPPNLPSSRKSQAYQLKGYLLLFEQILTNYLSQLGRFSELFSLDKSLANSYFSGSLESVPYLDKLIVDLNGSNHTLPSESLKQTVQSFLSSLEDFDSRRRAFLNHILARFGEKISSSKITRFNYYKSDNEQKKQTREAKIELLKEITLLSRERARSFNKLDPYWNTRNMAPVELKIRILLGLPLINRKYSKSLPKSIDLTAPSEAFDFRDVLSSHYGESFTILEEPIVTLEDTEIPLKVSAKEIRSFHIDGELFKTAVIPNNLAVVKNPTSKKEAYNLFVRVDNIKEYGEIELNILQGICRRFFEDKPNMVREIWWRAAKNDHYILQFDQETNLSNEQSNYTPSRIWRGIGKYKTEELALEAGSKLIGYLRKKHLGCEGFHLIDHILLRPRGPENMYGVHFINPEQNVSFKSSMWIAYSQVEKTALKSIINLRESEPAIRSGKNGTFRLHLQKNGADQGHSTIDFSSIEEATAHYKNVLKPYFQHFNELDLYNNQRVSYIKFYQADMNVDGKHYSFRTTVVLPNWTARFSDMEFRAALEQTFRLEVPAHIAIDFIWLEFDEMHAFEELYSQWLEALQKDGAFEELNKLSQKLLTQFLIQDETELNQAE